MWTVSCFLKVPLTAHYSKNSYNGEAALRNPIFMRTNRILTAAWGVLYLITPIWTCFIMQTDAASFVGAINSILPRADGRIHRLVSKVVSPAYSARIAEGLGIDDAVSAPLRLPSLYACLRIRPSGEQVLLRLTDDDYGAISSGLAPRAPLLSGQWLLRKRKGHQLEPMAWCFMVPPDTIRTVDTRFRRAVLYPLSY